MIYTGGGVMAHSQKHPLIQHLLPGGEHSENELRERGRHGGLKAAANKRAALRERQKCLARELTERAHEANEDICPVD